METAEFKAPWGRSLKIISWTGSILLLGLPLLSQIGGSPRLAGWIGILLVGVPYAIVLGAALFTVRGYRIEGQNLWIRRLLWSSRLSLRGLQGARRDPGALRKAWRVWGNGGLFSFSGWFRNRTLGSFRMWVTDPKQAVVLDLGRHRWVVSPDTPERFLTALGVSTPTAVESPSHPTP